MQRFRLVIHVFLLALAALPIRLAAAQEIVDHGELKTHFADQGLDGAFVLFDVGNNRYHVVNGERADIRRFPASTFKIANSLIALETGVVENENEIVPYGGKAQPVKSWERDMSMRDAIKVSNVPVYQELARRIGLTSYALWLDKLEYGNRTTGSDVEYFWLRGPLSISPKEQAEFIAQLAKGELNASQQNQRTVRDILFLENGPNGSLYAKGGWSIAAKPQVGWWVGWIERDEAIYTFALTIDIATAGDAGKRITLGRELLKALDIYE
ncbi:class D beta-lactamase [Hoeflea sp. TYP-13]|uniref:class D beta-lactamase n=1 Tax=Hoeflea sp. TYP-13 TaxID=3230023 RepID=UPI0034C6D5A1